MVTLSARTGNPTEPMTQGLLLWLPSKSTTREKKIVLTCCAFFYGKLGRESFCLQRSVKQSKTCFTRQENKDFS